jgi:hypothetical protein
MKALSNLNFFVIILTVKITLSYCTINQEMALHKLYYEPILFQLFTQLASLAQSRYLLVSFKFLNFVLPSLIYQAGANFIFNEH